MDQTQMAQMMELRGQRGDPGAGANPNGEPASPFKITELEKFYTDADDADKELFAEQRSNILLVMGDHYNKRRLNFLQRIRDARAITQEQKIRLTKNHIQKITDAYVNHIVSTAPGVGFEPAQASELKDQKAAELNHSVWEYARDKNALDEEIRDWCEDYVQIGEVATKQFYDPALDEIVFEPLFGFNLLVDPAATSFKKARHAILRKMVPVAALKKMFPGNDKYLQESSDQTYTIFDRGRGGYTRVKDHILVREYYFRPNGDMPQGYFYYSVKNKILTEGELPAGQFPIVFRGFKRMPTRARAQSIIKTLRPFQAEINRASSKMAEHQITLGDDKIILQNGSKVSAGVSLPGVRTVSVTGSPPVILPGRDGSQYLNYATSQVSEMYAAGNVEEAAGEAAAGQLDPYSLLFRAASQKKAFQIYIKGFEGFLKEVCTLHAELARFHYSDEKLTKIFGANEQVNLAEFRAMDPLCYKIKIKAQSDDIESKLGKQLVLNHTLQYVGGQLSKEDIGKIMRAMPYGNFEESFSDMTLDYDGATNDILALDRGEQPPVHPTDKHDYFIKRLTNRMRQADFDHKAPQIQQNYAARLQAHEQIMAQQAQEIQAAEAGFIPTSGYLVTCDFYVQEDPNDPTKVRRVRMPSDALQWLIQKLETQGGSLAQLESMNQANLAQIAQMTGGAGAQSGAPAMGQSHPGGVVSGQSGSQSNAGYNPGQFAAR